jgi:predicted transposase YbfD/YdcC
MAEAQPVTLWDALGQVEDHRSAHGRRFCLQGVLGIVLAALLAGRKSLAAIARWGRQLDGLQLRQFGIERPKGPCHATYHYVLKDLRTAALEGQLARWVRSLGPVNSLCMDGKSLRASHQEHYPALHLLALYCGQLQGVLGQQRVETTQENELSVALRLLKETPLEGVVVTGDAIFTDKELCREVVESGGDYLLVVKDNQPTLKEQIETAFAEPISPLGEQDVATGSGPGLQRRQGAWAAGGTLPGKHGAASRLYGLAGPEAGMPDPARSSSQGQGEYNDALRHHQLVETTGGCAQAAGSEPEPLGHREPTALRAGPGPGGGPLPGACAQCSPGAGSFA